MEKAKIYISYSRDDTDTRLIKKLITDLNSEKYSIVYDQDEGQVGGRDISRFIADEMDEADYILIIVTPSYVKKANKPYSDKMRSHVEIEMDNIIKRSQRKKESLLFVLAKQEKESEFLPRKLDTMDYHDMSSDAHYERSLNRLRHSLDTSRDNSQKECDWDNVPISLIEKIDEDEVNIEIMCDGTPPRLSTRILYKDTVILLSHKQTTDLFLREYRDWEWANGHIKQFASDAFFMPIKENSVDQFLKCIHDNKENYIMNLRKYEVGYEVENYKMLDGVCAYKIASIDRSLWLELIDFANNYDWDNGKSEWHIFQRNYNYIHVYSPVISYNRNLNAGEHVIYRAVKDDSIQHDYVTVYVDISDFVDLNHKSISYINGKDRWGIRTAAEWFEKKFLPFARTKIKQSDVERFCKDTFEETFSRLQYFYMSTRVIVNNRDIEMLKETLIIFLSKVFAQNDLGYIRSKLGIETGNRNYDPQQASQEIVDFLNSMDFKNNVDENGANSSLADDILRCIKVFTDSPYRSILGINGFKRAEQLNNHLIDRMNEYELLLKYRDI